VILSRLQHETVQAIPAEICPHHSPEYESFGFAALKAGNIRLGLAGYSSQEQLNDGIIHVMLTPILVIHFLINV